MPNRTRCEVTTILSSDELNRLTQENRELTETLASKEMTLESLRNNDDTMRYFMGLTNSLTLATLFIFVSAHLPSDRR